MFSWRKRHGRPTERSQRQFSKIRKLTQELITAANESERADVDGETTTSQTMKTVRALRHAQQALLESMKMATAAGVDSDAIRTQGIDHAALQSILMSDLAHYLVDEIRLRA